LGPSTASDPIVAVALWTAIMAAILSAAIIAQTVASRLLLARKARREAGFRNRWRAILLESVDAVPAHLPTVKPPDWYTFLSLWNQFQESLRGGGRHRLKAVAIRLRMDMAARRLLQEGSVSQRLMAIVTLGQLGDYDSWNPLVRISAGEHPVLSLAAARSLILIDAGRAIAELLPAFTARADWPVSRLKAILAEADPALITPALAAAVDVMNPARLPRLLALLDCAQGRAAGRKILDVLRRASEDEVLVACLKSAHVPRERELLARLTRHPSWQVRTQAARAFGLAAQAGDEKLLLSLLSDRVWWVRYRAAQALVSLPFLSREELLRLRSKVGDKFGLNMLDQVLAERPPT
jgi:HEAT repeat protein